MNNARALLHRRLLIFTMTSSDANASLGTAKSHFVEAVREGITVLTSQCGYSRERATSALLRELAKGEDRPTEAQVRLRDCIY